MHRCVKCDCPVTGGAKVCYGCEQRNRKGGHAKKTERAAASKRAREANDRPSSRPYRTPTTRLAPIFSAPERFQLRAFRADWDDDRPGEILAFRREME